MNNKDETFAKIKTPLVLEMGGVERQRVAFTLHDTGDDGLSGHWRGVVKNFLTGESWLCNDDEVLLVSETMVEEMAVLGTHFVYEASERLPHAVAGQPYVVTMGETRSADAQGSGSWQSPSRFELDGFLEATGEMRGEGWPGWDTSSDFADCIARRAHR